MTNEIKNRKKSQKGSVDKPKESGDAQIPKEKHAKGKKTPYKFGPLPKFNGGKETVLAKHGTIYNARGQYVECDKEYLEEIKSYTGCVPKRCARFVSDRIVTESEADILLWLAKRGMSLGGSNGGATIMDLHSGALSYEDNFINFYKSDKADFVSATDLMIYQLVRKRIQKLIGDSFGIDSNKLYLTYPTFFSRLTNKDAQKIHDEYWHVHVDKHTYESFHYTSLLYLNDYGRDFQGGRFIYLDKLNSPRHNSTVEPRKGRVSFFTSGAENPHFVERVTEGERFAMTISFTCDESKKISDPSLSYQKPK